MSEKKRSGLCARQTRLCLLVVTTFLITPAMSAQAQRIAPAPVKDVIALQSPCEISPMEFSPDGSRLAYTARLRISDPVPGSDFVRNGVPWWAFGCDVLVGATGQEARNLTGGKGDNWSPSWSPDGRLLAFLSNRDGSGQAKLWIWDEAKGEARKASDLDIRIGSGERIEWTSDSARVYVPVVEEIEDHKPNETNRNGQGGKFGHDPTVLLYESGTGSGNERNDRSDSVDLDRTLRNVVLLDITTGKYEVVVPRARIAAFRISGGRNLLAYSSPRQQQIPGAQQTLYDLIVVDLRSRKTTTLSHEVNLRRWDGFSFSPDGLTLAYRVAGSDQQGLFVVATDGGRVRAVCGETRATDRIPAFDIFRTRLHPSSSTPVWDRKGEVLYWTSEGDLWRGSLAGDCDRLVHIKDRAIEEVLTVSPGLVASAAGDENLLLAVTRSDSQGDGFYSLDLKKKSGTKLLEEEACYTSRCFTLMEGNVAAVTENGNRIAYIGQSAVHWPEIWLADNGFKTRVRLTHLNPSLEDIRMGQAERIEWLDEDGELLHGSLLLPSDYKQGTRYPLLVTVYGGAALSDSVDQFGGFFEPLGYLNAQLFATRGMAVLAPDAPQHLGTPMRDLAKTVLPGVNKVIEMGIADPDRLGVMGQSYGGYSTLSLIVQTSRFKVAVESNGMGDLIAFYGEMARDGTAFGTLSEHGQELMGGTPWAYRERYIENSPISYLEALHTPLLIIQGSDDMSVPSFLADELFVGLRRLGRTVSYAKYEGEGHVPAQYANRIDIANRVIGWIEKYLAGPHPTSQ